MTVPIRRNVVRLDEFEELPSTWNGPHVALRITKGFTTLRLLPRRDRLGVRSAWPPHMYEYFDLVAQAEQGELERTMRQQNRVRIQPSANEIACMEAALGWPAQYLRAQPELCEAVNAVAFAHSRGLDAGWVTKSRGGYADAWRERHDEGCERIAEGLIKDRLKVF
ncbi:hypothetical protein [Bradyrhizobium sp. STM 3562]|uniref:hypothetical protein n=1 Tax=Bradyrhizobium sp. STM 3562 TaxID=578924 RepID=UPI00388D174C